MIDKYGVCNYDIDGYNPKIEDLEIFDEYYKALSRYLGLKLTSDEYDSFSNNNLWIVYINEKNIIVQFEQLNWNVKCKLVEIKE